MDKNIKSHKDMQENKNINSHENIQENIQENINNDNAKIKKASDITRCNCQKLNKKNCIDCMYNELLYFVP
jgi:hypothetical protein